MILPLANSNEDLETISNNFFKPLFDVKKFEIRSEVKRDKGIDFHIELKIENNKKQNVYSNFRFAIQLKSTDSKKTNMDGSISIQLDTSNINYLLNNSMPAFYVLYSNKTNTFYFESVNDFARSLNNKNSDWNLQPSHILRFSRKLDKLGIEEMYKLTLKKGRFNRTVNEHIFEKTNLVNSQDKLIIDSDLNVTSDAEIRRLIENVGHVFINEGKWKDIVSIHKKATGNVATTARYNLVLGIASYYCGNMIEALGFLKSATKLKTELSEDLINHSLFFETLVKYSIGLLSDEEYDKRMRELENSDNLGLYIKLEKAKNDFLDSVSDNSSKEYNRYVEAVQNIMNDPKANENIILNARCELMYFEGNKNNIDYLQGIAMINAIEQEFGPNLILRQEAFTEFFQANEIWSKNVQSLKKEANETKNYFAYFTTIICEVRVTFEFESFTDLVFLEQELPGSPRLGEPDRKPTFDKMLEKITHACNYFNQIGHIENVVASLTTKYEIHHYLKDFETAKSILDEVENIIEAYDLNEQRTKVQILKKNGTNYEQFKALKDNIFNSINNNKTNFEDLRSKMILMDDEERKIKRILNANDLHIHLFPIGYFVFPESKKDFVYEILNINQEARKIFDSMFGIVIPIANICYNPITQEGPVNGNLAETGFESWQNIYRIRKAFFENKFYRNENIPG